MYDLKVGQVITKESFPRWYELHLKIIYWGIRKYQKMKWGNNWKAVHVYIVLPQGLHLALFEQTYPNAKYTKIEYLWDKSFAVCEWKNYEQLNINKLSEEADSRVGMKYDFGDLLDFAFSGIILKVWRHTFRVFGDKSKRLGVCSTVVARMLKAAGCSTINNALSCDPAYFEGNGKGWYVVKRVRCGEEQELV